MGFKGFRKGFRKDLSKPLVGLLPFLALVNSFSSLFTYSFPVLTFSWKICLKVIALAEAENLSFQIHLRTVEAYHGREF